MTVKAIMKDLKNKGHKRVDTYMRNRGWCLYDCIETETGYEAEWYMTNAGITNKRVFVVFTKNWRVQEVK